MEVWKDIPNYDGIYQTSNLGNVKSLMFGKERILKPRLNSNGYLYVVLSKNSDKKTITIHQLVAMCFLEHTPNKFKLVVDHIDGNTLNNNAKNLQLTTNRYNVSKGAKGCTSKYTGVYWNKPNSKWLAQIYANGKRQHLGYFNCELAAHNAYQKKLQQLNTTI